MLSRDRKLIAVIEANGIANAPVVVATFRVANLPLSVCLAMLEDESWGHMEWGADAWNEEAYPAGQALDPELHEHPVTRENYLSYRKLVRRGYQPQGCGSTQLTSPSLQAAADKIGGCWNTTANMLTGFRYLAGEIQAAGSLELGFQRYNGSGPLAMQYGVRLLALERDWHQRFTRAGLA